MTEQTAEERAAEGVNALLIKVEGLEKERDELRTANGEVGLMWAETEEAKNQAEAQRDSLKAQIQEWMEGSAQLQVKLDEAVRRLRQQHEALSPNKNLPHNLCAICDFISGLSTVTPEDWAGHLRERAEGGGKTEAELREKYRLTPRCERVSVCCGRPELEPTGFCEGCDGRDFKCKYHGCEWPQRGGECPSAGTGNVTT